MTFQEYLSAWNLAAKDIDEIKQIVLPHLRDQNWFEPLQLLGGELAKRSDENLDQYINFLLENLGRAVFEKAPIIALCANILKDVKDIAEITAILILANSRAATESRPYEVL